MTLLRDLHWVAKQTRKFPYNKTYFVFHWLIGCYNKEWLSLNLYDSHANFSTKVSASEQASKVSSVIASQCMQGLANTTSSRLDQVSNLHLLATLSGQIRRYKAVPQNIDCVFILYLSFKTPAVVEPDLLNFKYELRCF